MKDTRRGFFKALAAVATAPTPSTRSALPALYVRDGRVAGDVTVLKLDARQIADAVARAMPDVLRYQGAW